jgi:protein-tyrosine phosphatase
MRAEIYPIADVPCGKLAIMPRPRAGDWLAGEIESWQQSGIDCVVSLLEPAEIAELGLQDERELCEKAGLEFVQFPIPDRGVPNSKEDLAPLVETLVRQLQKGRGVAIHCRIGVGRSALVAACVLVALGRPIESVWQSIQDARRFSVPDTPEQRAWVAAFTTESAK